MKQGPKNKNFEKLACESGYFGRGFEFAVGIDEAGRGPLAGPVTAAAVGIRFDFGRDADFDYLLANVADSKKIGVAKRENLYKKIIKNKNIVWADALVSPKIIDKINILQASKKAMARATKKLIDSLPRPAAISKTICLIDGNFPIDIAFPQKSIIGGDARVFLISAASIIAKVRRDRLMERWDKIYPRYGFCRHKGYPTAEHLAAIKKYGLTPIHRRTFSPCAAILKMKQYNNKPF